MNEQLIKFIELCLMDGVITDKEREVIFRKSRELEVPDDECEIILEGMTSKFQSENHNLVKENQSSNKENINIEFRLNEDYFKSHFKKLDGINHFIKDLTNEKKDLNSWFEKYLEKNLNETWFQKFFISIEDLGKLITIKKRIFFKSVGTMEWDNGDKLTDICINERFLGYFVMEDRKPFPEESYIKTLEGFSEDSLDHELYHTNKTSYLLTNKGVWCFKRKEVEYGSHKYENNETFKTYYEILSDKEFCYNSDFVGLSYVRIELFKIYNRENTGKLNELFIVDQKKLLKVVDTEKLNLSNEDTKVVSKIDHHLTKQISEFNNLVKVTDLNPLYDYYYDEKMYSSRHVVDKTIPWKYENYGTNKTKLIDEISEMCKNLLSYVTVIQSLKYMYVVSSLENDLKTKNEIYHSLDEFKVFYDKFQIETTRHLENISLSLKDINKNLLKINKSILELNSNIISGFDSINKSFSSQNIILNQIKDEVNNTNWFTQLNTYFLYKINKNTKSLRD